MTNKPADVFVTDGFPDLTYVPLKEGEKEQAFREGLEQKNKIISISGPSKSGKTTLCKRMFSIGNEFDYAPVFITGDIVDKPEDLWNEALKRVLESRDKAIYDFSVAEKIQRLIDEKVVLVIDDFHYLPQAHQPQVCRQLKNAAAEGLRIVCLTVPHRRDDAFRGNPDLAGRFFSIDFDYWDEGDLLKIATAGFPNCEYLIPNSFSELLAHEALRSPQIMQTLCLETCRTCIPSIPIAENAFDDSFLATVKDKARRSYDRMSDLQILSEGPEVRGNPRDSYKSVSGEEIDVYQGLVAALKLDPPFLTLTLPEIKDRMDAIFPNQRPSNIVSALNQYQKLFSKPPSTRQAPVDWDGRNLAILDPHFFFYLRNS